MTLVDSLAAVVHVVFAGLWTGAVGFFAWRIHPLVASRSIDQNAAASTVTGLQWLTRAGVVVFLATGGHMAANLYTPEALTGTERGNLVLAMLGLWFVLTAVVEVMGARFHGALADEGLRAAADRSRPLAWIGAVLAVALLVVAGLLAV